MDESQHSERVPLCTPYVNVHIHETIFISHTSQNCIILPKKKTPCTLKGRVCFCVHYRGPEDSLYHNKLLLKEVKKRLGVKNCSRIH